MCLPPLQPGGVVLGAAPPHSFPRPVAAWLLGLLFWWFVSFSSFVFVFVVDVVPAAVDYLWYLVVAVVVVVILAAVVMVVVAD